MTIDINYEFIGWVNEGVHDKVYVVFNIDNTYYSAWGRRGAKLQFKKCRNSYEAFSLKNKKQQKYKPVEEFLLFTFFPNFREKVEEEVFMATLSGKIR